MYDINHLPQVIEIGRNGENLFREITFDLKPWLDILPDGVASIVLIRPGETSADSYIATTEFADGILTWNPSLADLGQVEGYGQMEIWLEEEISAGTYKRGKSAKVQTYVQGTIGPADADPPEPQESWLEQMTGLKTATVAAKEAAETAQTGAETAESNSEAWAVGQRDGTDVGSADPTYHNNSKYFAGQAGNSATSAANAKGAAETAQGKAEDAQRDAEAAQAAAEAAMARYPYVDVSTGNWMVYNPATRAWVNTGVHAKGDTGEVPDISIGNVETLASDQQAYVTRRSGSPDTAPIFDFGIPKGETGVPSNMYATTIPMASDDSTKISEAMAGKATKVSGATSGNFAGLDNNGNLVDSGHKHSDYLTSHQDISGKADKVTSATSGNFAALDENGNLTDSGHKHSDYLTSHQDISGKQDKTDSNLTTTAQTVVGAINEHESDLSTANADIDALEEGLAYIVGNTNTTGNTLAVGQFVYVKGHSTIAEGLRKVTASISANASITTSNTGACSEGGLNALNSNVNSIISSKSITPVSTLAELKSSLISFANTLSSKQRITIHFTPSFTNDEFVSGATYEGDLIIISQGSNFLYFTCFLYGVGIISICPIYIMYNNGTWTIAKSILDGVPLTTDYHNATSLDDLKTWLLTEMATLDIYKTKPITFRISYSGDSAFAYNMRYSGNFTCVQDANNGYYSGLFTSASGEVASIGYDNGTWFFRKVTTS